MNSGWARTIFCGPICRVAHAAMAGRNRDPRKPSKGRFTHSDQSATLEHGWQRHDRLAPSLPREAKLGNQMNTLLAWLTSCVYEALASSGLDRDAIELIGDMAWRVYKQWGRLLMFIARLTAREPSNRMRKSVNMPLTFPFTSPGCVFKRVPSNGGIALDMPRWPVAEYFAARGATDLCVRTRCNLDFVPAEMWGGRPERTESLAADPARCNFRLRTAT